MKNLFFIIFLLSSGTANALDYNLSIGHASWHKSDNGIWWQQPFPNDFNLRSKTETFEVTGEINNWSRWKLGYANLGTVNSYAEAVADDANYNGSGCNSPCLPLSHWYGYGKVTGAYLLFSPEYKSGDWKIFADVGMWNYKPQFIMTIPDWTPCFCAPQYLQVQGDDARQWGGVFGLGVSYKDLFVRFRVYRVDNGDHVYPAIYQKYTQDFSVGFTF